MISRSTRWRLSVLCLLSLLGFGLSFQATSAQTPTATYDCTEEEFGINCATATYVQQVNTALAQTDAAATPGFLDLLNTPTPRGTLGVNSTCPSGSFDTDDLDSEWAYVCRNCVDAVRPTVTQMFGQSIAIPTFQIDYSTYTPIPGTATFTPSPTNTPSPTLTPTGTITPRWTHVFNFAYGLQGWSLDGNSSLGGGAVNSGDQISGGSNPNYTYWRRADMSISFSARTIEYVRVNYYYTLGADGGAPDDRLSVIQLGGSSYAPSLKTPPTNGLHNEVYTMSAAYNSMRFVAYSDNDLAANVGGSVAVYEIELRGIGTDPFSAPPATFTPTPLPSATNTPVNTATPVWWGTSMPLNSNVSVNCAVPRYRDVEDTVASLAVGRGGEPACLTVLPDVNIGFDLAETIVNVVLDPDVVIPDLEVERLDVCFVGVAFNVTLMGYTLDLALLIGLPVIAFLFRWVMRQ